MIDLLVTLWLALTGSPGSAPREHMAAAGTAALATGVPIGKLLAIAEHESNFHADAFTREPGHRVSCGPMTPVPQARCSRSELTLLGGYLAGARHYAAWLAHCHGSTWCADLAYGGGMGLVRACAAGRRVLTARGGADACDLHLDLLRRERRLSRRAGT